MTSEEIIAHVKAALEDKTQTPWAYKFDDTFVDDAALYLDSLEPSVLLATVQQWTAEMPNDALRALNLLLAHKPKFCEALARMGKWRAAQPETQKERDPNREDFTEYEDESEVNEWLFLRKCLSMAEFVRKAYGEYGENGSQNLVAANALAEAVIPDLENEIALCEENDSVKAAKASLKES